MTKTLPRIYWDANAWIAYIKREMLQNEPRYDMCRSTLERAKNGEIEITTSAFTLAEVCKLSPITSPANNLPAFFQQPYVLVIPVDTEVGRKAQYIQLAGAVKRKPADALHIASALVANIPIFHTFDGYLLSLNKTLTLDNGGQLQIVKPTEEVPLPPLLERLANSPKEPPNGGG